MGKIICNQSKTRGSKPLKQTVYILVFIILTTGCAGVDEKRDFFYQKGLIQFQQKKYTKAVLYFQNALRVDPQFSDAYHKLGECEIRLNRWKEAIPYFRNAVRFSTDPWESRLSLAELLILAKNYNEARNNINIVIEKFPHNKRASFLSGILLSNENMEISTETIFPNLSLNRGSPKHNDKIDKTSNEENVSKDSQTNELAKYNKEQKKFDQITATLSKTVDEAHFLNSTPPSETSKQHISFDDGIVFRSSFSGISSSIMIIIGLFMFVLILFNRRRI